ncbi:hypothetical protein [Halomicrococcus sp. SG-WS-1]|uniref:hypothetical protein n=1 Tax=Halomicrococcus sp. SG-WS-1 TaxID=3439057 RepID=UPI003F7AE1F5
MRTEGLLLLQSHVERVPRNLRRSRDDGVDTSERLSLRGDDRYLSVEGTLERYGDEVGREDTDTGETAWKRTDRAAAIDFQATYRTATDATEASLDTLVGRFLAAKSRG